MKKKFRFIVYQGAQRTGKTATLEHMMRFADANNDVYPPGLFKKAIKNMEAQRQFDKLNKQ